MIRRIRHQLSRLLTLLQRWAESGWAGPAVGGWAVLQGSVVPGPSDVLLIPLGLADPPRVWRLVGWALLGATVGGVLAWGIGAAAFDEIGRPLFELAGITAGELARTEALFARYGWLLVAGSALSPVSTKLVCIAAGALGVPFSLFLLGIVSGRALRWVAVGVLVRYAGEWTRKWLSASH